MRVSFYHTDKRTNSTRSPSGSGLRYDVELLEPCTLLNPVIRLNDVPDISVLNYCFIPEWGRYYWVDNWEWSGGFWSAYLSVDVLTSWKEDILSSTQYVTRSATKFNGDITDNAYPATAQVIKKSNAVTGIEFNTLLQAGTYVVGIIGNTGSISSSMGAISYYTMTPGEFDQLGKALFDSSDWLELSGEDQSKLPVLKTNFNPLQYITSCKWYPTKFTGGLPTGEIKLGWWKIPVSCRLLGGPIARQLGTVTIPTHPQQPERGYFLNLPPYARYTMVAGPFGEIPLDGSYFIKDATMSLEIVTDHISGMAKLILSCPSSPEFYIARAQIGIDIAVSQLNSQKFSAGVGMVSGVSGGIASAAAGDVAGIFTGLTSAVSSACDFCVPQVQTTGSNGSRSEFTNPWKIVGEFFTVVNDDVELQGRPLFSRVSLSSLSGFCMVHKAKIEIGATEPEKQKIISYMEGGFYIE